MPAALDLAKRVCLKPALERPAHGHHPAPSRQCEWLQQAIGQAGQSAGLTKRIGCPTFRHSLAAHLLQQGYDIRTGPEPLGYNDVKTTTVYRQVLNRDRLAMRRRLDER
jgi:site-specific recombinase XerD